MHDTSFKQKVLNALAEQTDHLDEIETIKLILNTVSYRGILHLVQCNWKNNKRVLSLKDDTKNLIKALQNG